ncbi:hypothetical protein BIV25_30755 [Streptomyces sp. MUSC 14]|uniref:hypothetical protein n=1 Tax=Streptomyces sp. MUSC 14 TaxID=1354889 RepID=UPI0008F55BB6|nr:hypothetical protein [Streptomyces sp. MUSC 14]OIJ91105.1 hypothetical protein BIV25_30755 [Streptomyces sp. MUSC 14]
MMKTFRRGIPGKNSVVAAMILGVIAFAAPTATAATESPKPQSPAFDRCVHSAGPAGRYFYPGYANVPCL